MSNWMRWVIGFCSLGSIGFGVGGIWRQDNTDIFVGIWCAVYGVFLLLWSFANKYLSEN